MLQPDNPLEQLDALDAYRRLFTDAAFWQPYVQRVCERHRLSPCTAIRSGLPGTYPTFIVEERWVAKFFGRLFEGTKTCSVEREVNALLMRSRAIPAPALIACGQLFAEPGAWPWPYLIFEFMPGVSIGEVYADVPFEDKLTLARELGKLARRLHNLSIEHSTLLTPTWDAYAALLHAQRGRGVNAHRAWRILPEHLIAQIEAFLWPCEALVDRRVAPGLIHADLTRDHILGELEGGHWRTRGIIDYGDAMLADVYYELIALHLDLFRCDKRLLRAFLDAYGLDAAARAALPGKAMSLALLHRFNVLVCVFEAYPQAREAATLEQLAILLWDVDAPGLT